MLESIHVSGFKSLQDFFLRLEPGINILVGPNGAGKTNIVSFFEFLSHICSYDVSDAVLRSGGVATVLRRGPVDSDRLVSFTISGYQRIFYYQGENRTRHIRYQYTAEVRISSDKSQLYFAHQHLDVAHDPDEPQRSKRTGEYKWSLSLETISGEDLIASCNVTHIDLRKRATLTNVSSASANGMEVRRYLETNMRRSDLARNSLFLALDFIFPPLRNIRSDLISGEAYNIYPGSVKAREDISTPAGVRPDGTGTASTLFALSRISAVGPRRPINRPATQRNRELRLSPKIFDDVVALIKLVNRSVEDVHVFLEEAESFIRIDFDIFSQMGAIRVPLHRMSDGTLKWLAIITAISTNISMFAIEEPENYLHPYMQREIVRILRNNFGARSTRAFALITTHSETLLNAAEPKEVIVVSMQDGRSVAKRPSDPFALKEIISETGFGLGAIYVSGGLDND